MSKVSNPEFNQAGNNYPYNYDSVGGGEGYGMDPRLQAWVQQAQSYKTLYKKYLQDLSKGGIDASERQAYQTVMGYLNQLNGQLLEYGIDVGGWDPMMGDGFGAYGLGADAGMGVPSQAEGTPSTLPASSYQDTTQVMWDDDVKEVVATKTDFAGREKKFYGYEEVNFHVKGSAHATVTYEKDAKTGKMVTVVRVKWDSDGAEQKYVYANAKKVNVIAGSPDEQVTIDASVPAGKVVKKGVGEKNEEKATVKGDAPTGEKDGKPEWDLPNATIYPSGDGKEGNVFVSENLTFKAASTRDYWTVEWDAAKKLYVVKVYEDAAKTKMKNTYLVDEMVDKIFFGKDIEPTHLEFIGDLGDPADKTKPNPDAKNIQAQKIFVGTDSATAALNETKKVEYPDGLKFLLEGKKDQEILDALKAAGYSDIKLMEDFGKAIAEGEFPASPPDDKLIKFLGKIALGKNLFESIQKLYPDQKLTLVEDGNPLVFMFDDQQVTVDILSKEVTLGYPWPADQIEKYIPKSDHANEARELTRKIDAAVQGKKGWEDVLNYLNDMNSWNGSEAQEGDERLNDMIRKFVTALYRSSGANDENDPKFVKLLQRIPANVRYSLIDWVTHADGEGSEKQGGELWNTEETAGIIQASLDQENEKKKS